MKLRTHNSGLNGTIRPSQCCRLQHGLGLQLVAKSDMGDGNNVCTSFVLQSNELVFVVTAPHPAAAADKANSAIPGYDTEAAYAFLKKHGLAVRSIGALLSHNSLPCDPHPLLSRIVFTL